MLNIYNPTYERIGFVENFSYLSWHRNYSSCGSFELKVSPENIELFQIGNIITKTGDTEAAVIEYIALESVEKELLTVKGRFLTSLLSRHIVWNTVNLNGDLGQCIKQLIEENCINPADSIRKIQRLTFAETSLSVLINKQVSHNNLLEVIVALCTESSIGVKADLIGTVATISLYKGRELPIVFSREYENLLSQNYTDSILNYANVAKVGGEGEGSARIFVIVGDDDGVNRREIFVDAKDLRSEEYSNQQEYLSALENRGEEKLFELRRRQSFEAVVNPHSNLTYKTDFDLGDVVTIRSKLLNIDLRLRITEITETYDQSGLNLDIVFGDPLPTLTDRR